MEQRVTRLTKITAEVNRKLVESEGDTADKDDKDVEQEYNDQYIEINLSWILLAFNKIVYMYILSIHIFDITCKGHRIITFNFNYTT